MKKSKDVSKLVKQARKSLGLNGGSQQQLLRKARSQLELTNGELAAALGIKLPTLYSYLAPASAAKHRPLPGELRLLVGRMLEDHNRLKR